MGEQGLSRSLSPGRRLRHKDGSEVTITARKDDGSGWWLADDRGGLADFVIDNPSGSWEVIVDG